MKPSARELWSQEHDACFVPGCEATVRSGAILDTHEMVGGPVRQKTVLIPAFWIACCREHHSQLSSMPPQEMLVKELAWKRWADPEHYSPMTVIKLWRPKGTAELLREVISAVNAEYRRIAKEYGR